jgi:protein TonB
MKHLLLVAAFITSTALFAQTTNGSPQKPQEINTGDKVYQVVEQMPEYPGGDVAMMRFIYKNIVYPKMEKVDNSYGKVVVRFIINEDGTLSDVKAIKGFNLAMNAEAERVVKLMPKFKPGMQGGKAVKVSYNLPIIIDPTKN